MIRLPEKYLENMKILLKEEFDDYLSSFNNKPIHSLRINTNKISIRDFLNINPFRLTPISWSKDGFYFEDDPVSKHPYYYAGLYYIQEASAMLPAEVLPVKENDIVLDACGAPGGKSLKILNKLNNKGVLFSNDISVSRAQVLLKNIENQGFFNYVVMAQDLNDLDIFNNYFDCILLDAPCSGEGMFRKDNNLIKNWHDGINEYYADIQKKLIDKAIQLLKPSGHLVYSTCTFSIKENEEVIEYVLDRYPELQLLPIRKYDGFKDGLTSKTKECVRLYPHLIKGEGHFTALLRKDGNSDNQRNITDKDVNIDFIENLSKKFTDGMLIKRNDKCYINVRCDKDLSKLRILRNGLYLGEYRHERFIPAHALALNLKSDEYDNIINFSLDDERVIKYLKCETLDVRDRYVSGYVLVCVEGFPLGFGQVNKGTLKNRYPSNYRYQ